MLSVCIYPGALYILVFKRFYVLLNEYIASIFNYPERFHTVVVNTLIHNESHILYAKACGKQACLSYLCKFGVSDTIVSYMKFIIISICYMNFKVRQQ